MENIKCKIIATKVQLDNIGISYNLTGVIGYIEKEFKTGWYCVKVPDVKVNDLITNDVIVDIPKTFLKIYKSNLESIKIFVDMDNVLCDYSNAHTRALEKEPDIKYPQSQYGFFRNLKMIPNKFGYLNKFFDVRILSSPSGKNPLSYTEKRIWVEENLGLEAALDMILAPDKSIVGGENDYLIDDLDVHERSRQQHFKGTLIHYGSDEFPDWSSVGKYFEDKYKLKLYGKSS